MEVAEEGCADRGEHSSRLYRGGGCESRELDRRSYTTPTASFFRGFGFRFGHPFAGTRRFFFIPRVSILLSFSFSLYPDVNFSWSSFSLSHLSDLPWFSSCQPLSQSSASCHVWSNLAPCTVRACAACTRSSVSSRRLRGRARRCNCPSYGLLVLASRSCPTRCARCNVVPCTQVERLCRTKAITDKRAKETAYRTTKNGGEWECAEEGEVAATG